MIRLDSRSTARSDDDHPQLIRITWPDTDVGRPVEIQGGHPRDSYEIDAVEFFALDSLPAMSIGRSMPRQVRAQVRALGDARTAGGFRPGRQSLLVGCS